MLDKITMISCVWMVMVGAMLTATYTLYEKQPSNTAVASNAGVTQMTARAYRLN